MIPEASRARASLLVSTRGPILDPDLRERGAPAGTLRSTVARSLAARGRPPAPGRAAAAGTARAAGARLHPCKRVPSAIDAFVPPGSSSSAAKRTFVPNFAPRSPLPAHGEVALWYPAGLVRSAGWGVVAISSKCSSCLLSCRRMWKLITEALLVAQSTEQAARVPRARLTDEPPGGDRVVQLRVCEAPHSAIHAAGSQPRRKVRNRAPVRPVRDG